jgi:hypothetical protein
MRRLLGNGGRAAIALAVWLVVSFVPLVPVTQAPVAPDPIYKPALVSIQDLVGVGIFRLGISNHATWATLPAMIGLTAASLVGGWWLGGIVFRRRKARNCKSAA